VRRLEAPAIFVRQCPAHFLEMKECHDLHGSGLHVSFKLKAASCKPESREHPSDSGLTL
jgi:hypothetical protein